MFRIFQRRHRAWIALVCPLTVVLLAATPQAHANPKGVEQGGYLTKSETGEGFHFSHRDWEVACDNTRTCRAAGYHQQSDELKVSVLLTRAAGPDMAVMGELKIGQFDDDPAVATLPPAFELMLQINGRVIAPFHVKNLEAELPTLQISALLKALVGNNRIEFVHGDHRWRLSDRGATAALLKMDEFQGRIGTPGALARPGKQSGQSVRKPVAIPTVTAAPLPPPQPEDATFVSRYARDLIPMLKSDCPRLSDTGPMVPTLEATRLSGTQMLVSAVCWRGAYNVSSGNWIVQTSPPFTPQLVNDRASDLSGGAMTARHKGRGIGDCWSFDDWVWNGKTFKHTFSSTTGMCRAIEPGGAWSLPVWVTRVLP